METALSGWHFSLGPPYVAVFISGRGETLFFFFLSGQVAQVGTTNDILPFKATFFVVVLVHKEEVRYNHGG